MLEKISSNIFYMPAEEGTDRPIFGVVKGEKGSLIIDSGNSPMHAGKFLEKLPSNLIPRPELLVITHWHWDHTFGMSEFEIPKISSEETKEKLEQLKDLSWDDSSLDYRVKKGVEIEFCAEMIKKEYGPNRGQIKVELPEITFPTSIKVDFGLRTCLVEKVGGDHDPGSTVVFVCEDKVLFLGDCLAPNLYSPKWNYTTQAFLGLLEKIKGFGAEIYLGSHGNPIPAGELNREFEEWEIIARVVEKMGFDKEGVVEVIKEKLSRYPNEEDLEMVELFFNGLEIGKDKI